VVLVVSVFKVANGMEGSVQEAFRNRPHLVDNTPGFLGMEVLIDQQDESIFHLLTRWTDLASFRSWHSGPLLELDATHTVVRTFDVLAGEPGIPRYLSRSRSMHWLRASMGGTILAVNHAFEVLLQEPVGGLAGQSLWDRVPKRMPRPSGRSWIHKTGIAIHRYC
jgi:heme-degrading monooxygenase HmoA